MFGRWSMGTQVSSLLEATSQWWETARPAVQVPEYLQQTAPGEWIQSLLNHNNNEQQAGLTPTHNTSQNNVNASPAR